MFDKLINQILSDLNNTYINNLDEYVYELHEILPKYIVNVPEQNSEEFYEFAGKIMQYVIDTDINILPITVAETFARCYDEICFVTNALSSQCGEDITDDIIKILFCYIDASGNTLSYSEDLENTLDLIFTYINHDWVNMVDVTLDWDRVCNKVLPSEIDDEYEDYTDVSQSILDDFISNLSKEFITCDEEILNNLPEGLNFNQAKLYLIDINWTIVSDDEFYSEDEDEYPEDYDKFGLEDCFTRQCVEGSKSAEHFLELVYKDNGWIGHPEDDIKVGTDFPNYGLITQDEAEWFNANMTAVFDYYTGDPSEYALNQIDPEES